MGAESVHIETLDFIPDLLAIHASFPKCYPHLLASNATENSQSRFDILFACPQSTLTKSSTSSFLDELDTIWKQQRVDEMTIDLPFYGGWFLYLGYELANEIEPSLNLLEATDGLPVAFATRFPAAIIIDHKNNSACIVCEVTSLSCLEQIKSDLKELMSAEIYHQKIEIDYLSEDDEKSYFDQLSKVQDYIIEGDVFQVNLSRGWQAKLTHPVNHASLFYNLVKNNPGPFNALVTMGDKAIVSSSPERLIETRHGIIETRPIAGTRPRAVNSQTDVDLSNDLMANAKEKAEHIMLIDLERNDLGRICESGSVEVNELMALETYQHVHHIVSNVRGHLKQNISPGDTIKAVFPGGTITGCPKVRCMEILSELEISGRGAYTGSLGYLNLDGSMDLNILIRTIVRNNNKLMFRAGGGIVTDSKPAHELNETRAKAKAMVLSLQQN